MKYWLLKSEPENYSIDDLAAQPGKRDHWDGIRNYQARNFMRDEMKKGDLAFFYHSNCDVPAVVGVVEIVKQAYVDPTAFDPDEKYYDAKSDPDNPRWLMVDVKFKKKLKNSVSLATIKQTASLADMRLVQKGNRLSIMPVTKKQWDIIVKMSEA